MKIRKTTGVCCCRGSQVSLNVLRFSTRSFLQCCGFLTVQALFLQKIKSMDTAKSTKKYWVYFFISLLALIGMLVFYREFFWVVLPFVVTFFALALDIV